MSDLRGRSARAPKTEVRSGPSAALATSHPHSILPTRLRHPLALGGTHRKQYRQVCVTVCSGTLLFKSSNVSIRLLAIDTSDITRTPRETENLPATSPTYLRSTCLAGFAFSHSWARLFNDAKTKRCCVPATTRVVFEQQAQSRRQGNAVRPPSCVASVSPSRTYRMMLGEGPGASSVSRA